MALDGFSVELDCGLTGLVGPNGAGKTTLLRILAGIEAPSSGSIEVAGVGSVASAAARSSLRAVAGFMPQDPRWMTEVTVRGFVDYCLSMRGVRRAHRERLALTAIEDVNAGEFAERRLGQLSGGERRRAFLAASIAHEPEILILDEPTVGLDPQERLSFRSLVRGLSEDRVVVLSTHLIEDLGLSADRIVVIRRGTLAWDGAPVELADCGVASPELSALESGYVRVLEGESS